MSDVDDETHISTGIDELDRQLGGLRYGSLIAVRAPPDSQTEVFLEEMADSHPSVFFSFLRSEDQILTSFEDHGVNIDGAFRAKFLGNVDDPLEHLLMGVERAASNDVSVLIVDPITTIERHYDYRKYADALRQLTEIAIKENAIIFLHCTTGEGSPEHRDLTMTMADIVLDFKQEVNGEDLNTKLFVPKYRGDKALSESLRLEISDEVAVDTSREIA